MWLVNEPITVLIVSLLQDTLDWVKLVTHHIVTSKILLSKDIFQVPTYEYVHDKAYVTYSRSGRPISPRLAILWSNSGLLSGPWSVERDHSKLDSYRSLLMKLFWSGTFKCGFIWSVDLLLSVDTLMIQIKPNLNILLQHFSNMNAVLFQL